VTTFRTGKCSWLLFYGYILAIWPCRHPDVRPVVSKYSELSADGGDVASKGIIPSIVSLSDVAVTLIASIFN
jgi:hypothetical protein